MAEYCSTDNLRDRLTTNGIKWAADRENGGDGSVDSTEKSRYLDSSIAYAGNIVDGYICNQVAVGTARDSGNAWLRDRCLDIAAYRACGVGGRDTPGTIERDYKFTMTELERIKGGDQIPGYPYPGPVNAQAIVRTPRAANWCEKPKWGNRWR